MEGPFTFETLSAQESLEKKSRTLTRIESRFFRYVANYLEQLEASYRKEQEKNASSKRAAFLMDELRNATNKVEELWKAREKKIVQFAQVNARKDPSPQPPENLTREESALYQALSQLFRDHWTRLLPQRNGLSPASALPTKEPVTVPMTAPAASGSPSSAPVSTNSPVATVSADAPAEAQTIRALVDIPPFVGFDGKTYRIKKGEVLTLPKKFAAILKERNQVAIVA